MGEKELQQFDKFYADFVPQRMDDLRDSTRPFLNGRYLWQAWWVVEEDDYSDGKYAGQWACVVIGDDGDRVRGLGWVPDGDLLERSFLGAVEAEE